MNKRKRRSSFSIMLSLLGLLKPLLYAVIVAVLMGTLGFLSAFGLSVFGVYAVISAIPSLADLTKNIFLGGYPTETYVTLLLICGFSRGILHYIEQLFNHLLAFKILAMIRNKVFAAMRRLAPAKLETKNPGDLISVIMGDIELLEVFYAHTISPIAIAIVCTIILMTFYLSINPLLAIIPLLSQITVGIIFPWVASKKGEKISVEIRENIAGLNGQFIDKLRGIRDIIQYDSGEEALDELNKVTAELLDKQENIKQQLSTLSSYTDSSIILFSVFQAFVSYYLISEGVISIPAGAISTILTLSSFGPYISLANLGNTLTHTFACGDRVLSILEESPKVEAVTDGIDVDTGDIKFENVTFSYDEKTEPVLKDVNLSISKGDILGISGESGSGKSTLLKLIMRFWAPQKGKIFLNGENLKNINTHSLYSKINYMTQNTFLFTGTIRDNLLIAKPDASEEEIYSALKKASIYDYVMSVEDGLDAKVGEDGVNFSGGERQRLGLARNFLADRDILFLDEPTSNIDSINEAIVLNAITRERKDKTIVFVSHRESTLGISNKIIKVNKGIVIN